MSLYRGRPTEEERYWIMETICSSWKRTKLNSALLKGVTPLQVGPPVVQDPALLHPVPTNASRDPEVGERQTTHRR